MNATISPPNQKSLVTSAAIGGAIALAAISFFVFGVDNPDPAWPTNWRIRPLIFTPLAGIAGGILFHFVKNFHANSPAMRFLLTAMAAFGYLIALWMGIILGLDGTLWD